MSGDSKNLSCRSIRASISSRSGHDSPCQIALSSFVVTLAPNLRRFVKEESSLKKTSEQKVEMENSEMQNLTQGEENMAITSPDDRVQVEEQAVSSNAAAVIRDQNDQIPADNGVGSGSELISTSTVARAGYVYLQRRVETRFVYLQRPHSQLLPIHIHSSAVRRFTSLASSSGPANLQPVSASYRRSLIRDLRPGLVPEERDDGDISEELRNAVEAGDDIPVGHIRVPVTVLNTCPIAGCGSKSYVRFMTLVSPEDAPSLLSETTTAYFNCSRLGCDVTFELEEDPEDRYNHSSHAPCPLCNSPTETSFLFSSRFWKRFTRQLCRGCREEVDLEWGILRLDGLQLDID